MYVLPTSLGIDHTTESFGKFDMSILRVPVRSTRDNLGYDFVLENSAMPHLKTLLCSIAMRM